VDVVTGLGRIESCKVRAFEVVQQFVRVVLLVGREIPVSMGHAVANTFK